MFHGVTNQSQVFRLESRHLAGGIAAQGMTVIAGTRNEVTGALLCSHLRPEVVQVGRAYAVSERGSYNIAMIRHRVTAGEVSQGKIERVFGLLVRTQGKAAGGEYWAVVQSDAVLGGQRLALGPEQFGVVFMLGLAGLDDHLAGRLGIGNAPLCLDPFDVLPALGKSFNLLARVTGQLEGAIGTPLDGVTNLLDTVGEFSQVDCVNEAPGLIDFLGVSPRQWPLGICVRLVMKVW